MSTSRVDSPIGVFDSGIGGLTVLRALHRRLPGESTAYLGDTARVPYGTRSARVVCRYAVNNARFLLERADVKLLVVACNTASAVAMAALADAVTVPVLGVVEPGAELAARTTRTGRVAVIGTRGTVASGAYVRAIQAVDPRVEVVSVACPLLVPLAEEGWIEGQVPRQVVERYLGHLPGLDVDTIVLGCTHYPLLAPVMTEVLGPEVELVDSASTVAEATHSLLSRVGIQAPATMAGEGDRLGAGAAAEPGPPGDARVSRRIFVTDVPDSFGELAGRFLGDEPPEPEQVDVPT